jgi:hypothetical protein
MTAAALIKQVARRGCRRTLNPSQQRHGLAETPGGAERPIDQQAFPIRLIRRLTVAAAVSNHASETLDNRDALNMTNFAAY